MTTSSSRNQCNCGGRNGMEEVGFESQLLQFFMTVAHFCGDFEGFHALID
jgi:hypothetical protein